MDFTCRICKKAYPDVSPLRTNGKHAKKPKFTSICTVCANERSKDRQKTLARSGNRKLMSTRILRNCRNTDRTKGWKNNLTQEWIENNLPEACVYCGETNLAMSLDRIDNNLPHNIENVVPCCIRCNLTRKAMPYEAWLVVAEGMRKARELGLFGSYNGGSNAKYAGN